ncbi:hypothetical protein [Amycolatopsis anabasis]|uniref:glycan biosynthesis hexose transferase WsfD n=1 Tax=Amycolatopsis anabasis TaxID=1840409 RepID=UPI00131CE93C|nr:hypothetical protein [Amycolatopsis anabasis]
MLVGIGVALWVLALPPSLCAPQRILVGCVVGLIMVDSGIARFYASPYTETAALLGVFLLCPALLWLLSQRRYTWGPLLAVAGIGTFTLVAKTQMISMWPALIVVLLLRPSLPARWHAGLRTPRSRGPIRRSRLIHWLWVRLPALALALIVTTAAFGTMSSQPKRYSEINAYSQIFTTMLPMSPNPQNDLRWFGLDPALARGSGTNIYSSNTVAYEPAYQDFTEAVTEGKVAMFYLSQPGRFVKLVDTGMKGMAGYGTETYMANYPAEAGLAPYAKENRIAVITWMASVFRAVPWLFALQWLLVLLVCVTVARRSRRAPRRQSVGILGLVLLGALTTQFWAVMMSEGQNEIFKHMVVVDQMMFLTIPVLLTAWLQRRKSHVLVNADAAGKS